MENTKQLLVDFIDIYGDALLSNNGDNPIIDNLVERLNQQLNKAVVSGNEVIPEIKQSGEVALPFFCISYMQKMGRCYDQCSACEFLDKNKNGNDR